MRPVATTSLDGLTSIGCETPAMRQPPSAVGVRSAPIEGGPTDGNRDRGPDAVKQAVGEHLGFTVELEGSAKPACVVENVTRSPR